MNFEVKGITVWEPAAEDTETNHRLYQWLKTHKESLDGSAAYDEILEEYQVTRIEWEVQGVAKITSYRHKRSLA